MKIIPESFLHFVWRWKRFNALHLQTTEGRTVEILHPGEWNRDAGPDFFNARIRIGDTEWAGNVEMHLRASDWLKHGHQSDPAYDNVVLHAVWEEDFPVLRRNGDRIACLELKNRIPKRVLEHFLCLDAPESWIPCASFWNGAPEIVKLNWFDRLAVERLEQKTQALALRLEQTGRHWEEAFYQTLARSFGLKVNTEPFEALARSLPLFLLLKHQNRPFQVEALLFGQANMLAFDYADNYPCELAREYRHLAHKYQLRPIPEGQWKYLRLRPANFPMIRIAQFAALVSAAAPLLSKVLEAETLSDLEHLFAVPPSSYWKNHYLFDRPSHFRDRAPGADFIHLLTINTLAPFIFYYGKIKKEERFQKRAFEWLEALPAEENAVIDGWKKLNQIPRSAYQSQALIQLKSQYCDAKRCLECAVGHAVLR